MSRAEVSDPELIRAVRRRLAGFLTLASAALGGAAAELRRVHDWLWGVQRPFWQGELRRRHEAFEVARRAWAAADIEVRSAAQSRGPRKQDCTEERLAMERARRARDAAETRLAIVDRWLVRLDGDGAPLVHACRGHELALTSAGAEALLRLDRLADRVDDYLAVPAVDLAGDPRPLATPTSPAEARAPEQDVGTEPPCAS